jgi:hypothetical protein
MATMLMYLMANPLGDMDLKLANLRKLLAKA